jgi:glucose 1-dehydrogenase
MSVLTGQVAVVTGGRGDIGAAIVDALAASGAAVAVGDIAPLPTAPDMSGPSVVHEIVDVTDPAAVSAWIDRVERDIGPPTIVIPAAATATAATPLSMTAEQWTAELSADLNAPFFVTTEAARRMITAGLPGRIVMIGSWAGHAPHVHVPGYSVAKAGLRMLTKLLAIELAPHQILVNEVAIGVVDAGVSRKTFRTHPELRARSEQIAPVRRLVGIDEVTSQVLNLCAPDLHSMTGSTILLDGGMSLRTAFTDAGEDDRP